MNRSTGARLVLGSLAFTSLAIGAWALAGPSSWFEGFPGAGRRWTVVLGPFNEHLARDVGAFNLMLGALYAWAGVTLDRTLVRAVTLSSLLFAVPHTVFHAFNLADYSTSDQITQMIALSATVVGPVAALLLAGTRRSPQHYPGE